MEWQEFLTKFVKTWRNEFSKLSDQEKKAFQGNILWHYHFLEPCQIEVIDVIEPRTVIWIITRDKDRGDMEFIIHSNVTESLESFLANKQDQDHVWSRKFQRIIPRLLRFHENRENVWSFEGEITFCVRTNNLLETNPVRYAHSKIESKVSWVKRSIIRQDIEKTTNQIKSDVERIDDENLRIRFFETTNRLEHSLSQIKRLDEHERKLRLMEDEIVGVRKLVGTKGFGEWKSLVLDVEYLKKRVEDVSDIRESYKEVLDHQTKVLDNQAKVLAQQSNFISWIKYSTILVPVAVACVPIIETLIQHILSS